jgi:hypothetical protein
MRCYLLCDRPEARLNKDLIAKIKPKEVHRLEKNIARLSSWFNWTPFKTFSCLEAEVLNSLKFYRIESTCCTI